MTSTQLSRKPFYVHIATLFILLFSVLGGALILLQFQQGMQQGLAHERQSFQHYREQLALAITLNRALGGGAARHGGAAADPRAQTGHCATTSSAGSG